MLVKLTTTNIRPRIVPTSPPTYEKKESSLLNERAQLVDFEDFIKKNEAYRSSVTSKAMFWKIQGTITPFSTTFYVKGRRLTSVSMTQSSICPLLSAPCFVVNLIYDSSSMQYLRQSQSPGLIKGLIKLRDRTNCSNNRSQQSIVALLAQGLDRSLVALHFVTLISRTFISAELNLPFMLKLYPIGGHSQVSISKFAVFFLISSVRPKC